MDQPVSQFQFSRYLRLIEYAKANPAQGRVERHHIVPRSMGGSNHKDNLIALSLRLHFIAHWLLWKAYRNAKMANAFWTMACCNGNKLNSKTYAQVRDVSVQQMANSKRGKTTSDKQKAVVSAMMRGRTVSEETRRKISEATKGKKRSDEVRLAMSISRIGRKPSSETKAKMSLAKKDKPPNNAGKIYKVKNPRSLEERLKMSERMKKFIAMKKIITPIPSATPPLPWQTI